VQLLKRQDGGVQVGKFCAKLGENTGLTLSHTPGLREWTQESVGADGNSRTESYDAQSDNRYHSLTGDSDEATFA
jgi:hypothetical protein